MQIDTQTVKALIIKARAMAGGEGVVNPDPGSNGVDDGFRTALQDGDGDDMYTVVVENLRGLSRGEQLDLLALLYIGRDDFAAEEWDTARKAAEDAAHSDVPEQLVSQPLLAEHIANGLVAVTGETVIGS